MGSSTPHGTAARANESAGARVETDSLAHCFRYVCAWHGFSAAEIEAALPVGGDATPKSLLAPAEKLGLA